MQPNPSAQKKLIQECQRGERLAQRLLFKKFYSLGMRLCLRYTANQEEAKEMLNDGFFKILTNIKQFDLNLPFIPWLKTVLIHSAIDYHRRKKTFRYKIILLWD